MFQDRLHAGLILAEKLEKFKGDKGVVLAVPRGGVPVAYVVARELGFPLDIILTKKIGHPLNKEYAIGAASLTDFAIIPHEGVDEQYIRQEVEKVQAGLREMYKRFSGSVEMENIKGKTVIVIDDGAATGNTLMATIEVLRKSEPKKIIIALPVATAEAVRKLSKYADEMVVVLIPKVFFGVGAFYEDFEQVSDEEVMLYLDKMRQLKKTG